ncbi:Rrf2 family transcriptional regulator [Candidatus Uhrbacteria bacterium]|nr:Rrf2 family transcriptional regulator [Candidatus Uhrbacteria bacterium]MBD3284353.1 Rrf2 family transcriptional regulator [Candidatus Uhrbacteria bacterium]
MNGFFRIPERLHLGLILMTELAQSMEPLSLREIGSRMQVSEGYLEAIAARLKKADLVQGLKGPNGGYRLRMPPGQIRLDAIITAIEGPVALVDCHGEGVCPVQGRCHSKKVWDVLQSDIQASLKQRTLADVI